MLLLYILQFIMHSSNSHAYNCVCVCVSKTHMVMKRRTRRLMEAATTVRPKRMKTRERAT